MTANQICLIIVVGVAYWNLAVLFKEGENDEEEEKRET